MEAMGVKVGTASHKNKIKNHTSLTSPLPKRMDKRNLALGCEVGDLIQITSTEI